MSDKLIHRVQELEDKNHLISENLIDAIWIIDAKTLKYDYITTSIEKISGYTADEYVKSSIAERMSPDSLNKVKKIIEEEQKKFSEGFTGIRKVELEMYHKEGHTYWIEIRAKFIKESDKPLKIIGVSREISDQKKNEEKQDELVEKLGKALAENEKLVKKIKTLSRLLPICSGCKRIRDENGKWWPLDLYVSEKTQSKITHTYCPDCSDVYYSVKPE